MKTITRYHITIVGWNKTLANGGVERAVRISLTDTNLLSAIKRAKKIYPKKHWWVSDITEHMEPIEQIRVQTRMAKAMEEALKT